MKLSILMPVYNEAETIAEVVERVLAVPLEKEIVLVNDASKDGTAEIVNRFPAEKVRVLHHPVNRGKGAGISTALQAATGDVIVIQDADFEYNPADLVALFELIASGKADVVFGVRSLHTQRLVMRLGNSFVTLVANLLYGLHLKDIETCYKMMRRDIALRLNLECRRFDVEAEITAKLGRCGYKIHELPIEYTARYENKKLSPLDGIPTIKALWKYRRWQPE